MSDKDMKLEDKEIIAAISVRIRKIYEKQKTPQAKVRLEIAGDMLRSAINYMEE